MTEQRRQERVEAGRGGGASRDSATAAGSKQRQSLAAALAPLLLTESFHLGCLLTMEIMSPVCPLLNSSAMDSESLHGQKQAEAGGVRG